MSAARRPTRAGRIYAFLAVTYPPLPMLAVMLVASAGLYFTLEAIALHARLLYSWRMLGAAFTGFLMTLLLRVYDELKDADADRRLAAAGDPKYMTRPIVTGLVDVEDLHALRWAIVGAAVVVNLFLGPLTIAAFAVVYVTGWLSYRWFFWPKMREHLLVAFVTHNPLTSVMNLYLVAVFAADFGTGGLTAAAVASAVVARQGIVSAWEIGRKIRAPEEETAYLTYSRALGTRGSALAAAAAVVIAAACFVWAGELAELGVVYAIVTCAGAVVPLAALARFLVAPSAKRSKLQPAMEAFAGVVSLATLVALAVRWGMGVAPIR